MIKKGFKGRCQKRQMKKCKEVVRTYGAIQLAYAERLKSLHSDQNIKQIQITDFQVGMDGICKLLYYNKGIKIKEYLLNISKMNYSNYSSVISLELNDISLVDEGYIAYSAAGHGFGNEYPRVYFSSGEKIIIKRKENL